MIIDDEPLVLRLAKYTLEKNGYTVHAFDNPVDAVAFYREKREGVDLVVLDMVMPDMDGVAVLKSLHALNPRVRAVLCSGYNQDSQAKDLAPLGVCGMIQKPFDTMELLAGVSRALAEPAA